MAWLLLGEFMRKLTLTSIFIAISPFSFQAHAQSQDINGVELGSLILSGVCYENSYNEMVDMLDFLHHYASVHRYIGSECDYDTSIDISNDINKMISGIQSLQNACEYNQDQLERVYLDYGVDLNAGNVKSHPNFDMSMRILVEDPENPEHYTYYEEDAFYLINEDHIECENLNLDVIEELIELGASDDSEIY